MKPELKFPGWLRIVLYSIMSLVLLTCAKDDPPQPLTLASEHFILETTTDKATAAEAEEVLDRAEELWAAIGEFFGDSTDRPEKLLILLKGNEAGTRGPYVDPEGIHMYRYSAGEGGYLAALAHELVHAFRIPWYISVESWTWPTYGFYDEALAEYVAQEVDPEKHGYPFYGFDENVIAGSFLKRETHIPFDTMRNHHVELNSICLLQMYTTRASWARYIHENYGAEGLRKVFFPNQEPTDELLRQWIGSGLADLDAEWKEWILARYDATPGADNIANQYWNRVDWYNICVKGQDF